MTRCEIEKKYGIKANHEPKADCSKCAGAGEWTTKSGKQTFCICLFVDHGFCDEAGRLLGEAVKRINVAEGAQK